MIVSFKKIFEPDMDLLIIEEFLCDRSFAKIFLETICFKSVLPIKPEPPVISMFIM